MTKLFPFSGQVVAILQGPVGEGGVGLELGVVLVDHLCQHHLDLDVEVAKVLEDVGDVALVHPLGEGSQEDEPGCGVLGQLVLAGGADVVEVGHVGLEPVGMLKVHGNCEANEAGNGHKAGFVVRLGAENLGHVLP
eukprot:GHVR01136341.1.p2 GENE.GHVR01136341.1~~GHVR01136341.1.p2  ORF type:complete len:136 (+),score=21.79 GHVR01136341.1:208-615(+)